MKKELIELPSGMMINLTNLAFVEFETDEQAIQARANFTGNSGEQVLDEKDSKYLQGELRALIRQQH